MKVHITAPNLFQLLIWRAMISKRHHFLFRRVCNLKGIASPKLVLSPRPAQTQTDVLSWVFSHDSGWQTNQKGWCNGGVGRSLPRSDPVVVNRVGSVCFVHFWRNDKKRVKYFVLRLELCDTTCMTLSGLQLPVFYLVQKAFNGRAHLHNKTLSVSVSAFQLEQFLWFDTCVSPQSVKSQN